MTTPVAAITDYVSLQQAIADILVRDDIPTQIQFCINQAETRFNRTLRVREMENKLDTNTVAGQADYPLPADFLSLRSARILQNPVVWLAYKTPQQIHTVYRSQAVGTPSAYTIFGGFMTLAPVPSGTSPLSLWYYQSIPSLASAGTNWLLELHPDLYFYGALSQAAVYVSDDTAVQKYNSIYNGLLDELTQSEAKAQWDGSPLTPNVDVWCP